MSRFSIGQIRHYYDRNTEAFLAYGQGGGIGTIHRAVWGPGVSDRTQAFRYPEDRIVELLRALPAREEPLHVVDLGCGVGATLRHLAGQLPIRGTGVTLSPVQARIAERDTREAGLAERVRCFEGDYCALPELIGAADFAYAIESFIHGPDPARFFAECRRVVRPGGLLAICDDFALADRSRVSARTFEEFERGWHVNSLVTADELHALAADAGFAHRITHDLTPYLELGRPRDHAIALLVPALRRLPIAHPRIAALLGGAALQECLARGAVGYHLAVFERVADAFAERPAAAAAQ